MMSCVMTNILLFVNGEEAFLLMRQGCSSAGLSHVLRLDSERAVCYGRGLFFVAAPGVSARRRFARSLL